MLKGVFGEVISQDYCDELLFRQAWDSIVRSIFIFIPAYDRAVIDKVAYSATIKANLLAWDGIVKVTILGLLLFAFLVALPARLAVAAVVTDVNIADQGGATRVTVTFDGPVQASSYFLIENPSRVVLELPGVYTPSPKAWPGMAVVGGVRLGQFKTGVARLVLDLAQFATVSSTDLQDPIRGDGYKVVFILKLAEETTFNRALKQGRKTVTPAPQLAAASTTPPLGSKIAAPVKSKEGVKDKEEVASSNAVNSTSAPGVGATSGQTASTSPSATPAPSPERRSSAVPVRGRIPVVVIDAGHGGQDPGAPSVIPGRYEKEATLAIARAIKNELEASGKVKAFLTRSGDSFIPLGQRVEIARAQKADLFISIHADSIADPAVRGATVYTLSETASDKEAERLAAKENKADIIAGINLGAESPDVTNILIDLIQRETMNYSAEFAAVAVREISPFTLFRSNNHRFAGFRVLKAADVPSILLETGYMSNLLDSQYLFSPEGQVSIAKGVRRAVEAFFDRRLARTSAATATP